jgi:Holliday junction resolvase RusA-like endonuclease
MIVLPYPPSVNTAYGQSKGRRRFKSKKYLAWLSKCPKLYPSKIRYEVEILYKIYFPDNRIRDGQNILKVVLDYLVSQGVLADDNWHIVTSEKWVSCGIDKNNPRVEVFIESKLPFNI